MRDRFNLFHMVGGLQRDNFHILLLSKKLFQCVCLQSLLGRGGIRLGRLVNARVVFLNSLLGSKDVRTKSSTGVVGCVLTFCPYCLRIIRKNEKISEHLRRPALSLSRHWRGRQGRKSCFAPVASGDREASSKVLPCKTAHCLSEAKARFSLCESHKRSSS